jgi:CheY-like chemotaxis protein
MLDASRPTLTLRTETRREADVSVVSIEAEGSGPSALGVAAIPTVVLCDDEAIIRKMYRRTLRGDDVAVVEAADADECLELVARLQPDLVVLDLTLPGRSGFDVLPEILALSPATSVVVSSGMVTPAVVHEAIELGATACVEKVAFAPQLRTLVGELTR